MAFDSELVFECVRGAPDVFDELRKRDAPVAVDQEDSVGMNRGVRDFLAHRPLTRFEDRGGPSVDGLGCKLERTASDLQNGRGLSVIHGLSWPKRALLAGKNN